jgi:DNA-directed RNA polymerase sigma subunit (sigma70/sigma32)
MNRYDKMRKTDRNRLLNEYIDNHPEATFEEVGAMFKITKQRVWELRQQELKQREKNKGAAAIATVAPR